MTTEMVRLTVAPLEFTDEQRKMIRDAFANGANEQEFGVLMEVAKARRLNPLMRQIHFVSRWDSQKSRNVWATQVSIDGLRAIAERTGIYAGQDEPEFVESPDGAIKCCKVRVYRKDWGDRAAVGVAYWNEYVQTYREKSSGKEVATPMWRKMPHVMIAKCAEAIALRKAFPEDMSGLYTPDEMGQAENDRVVDTTAETVVDTHPVASTQRRPTYPAPVASSPTMPVPADPVALATRGIEPPMRPALPPIPARIDSDVIVPSVMDGAGGDNPTLGEANAEAAEIAREHNAAWDAFITACEDIALPGDALNVWLRHRGRLAPLDVKAREAAWKHITDRVEAVGKMKNAKVWLKKAVAEADSRGEPPPDGTSGPTRRSNGRDTTATGNGAANDSARADGAVACVRDPVWSQSADELRRHLDTKTCVTMLRNSLAAHAAELTADACALYAQRYADLWAAMPDHLGGTLHPRSARAWVDGVLAQAARGERRAA